jgi:hypothetical protein
LGESFDTKKFLNEWKEKGEWLFALGVVSAGLEREGNFDAAAAEEISSALRELNISKEELRKYVKRNRRKLLRFLDSSKESA